MMKNSLFGKAIIYWIIILFIGAGVVLNASVSGTGEEPIELNFSFDEPTIENITINATTYNRVIMSGLSNSNIPGEPCLPIQPVNVLIPQNYTVGEINVTVEGKTFLNGSFFVEPGQQPYPISYNWSNHTGPWTTSPNMTIYNSSEHYPNSTFQSFSIQKKRGYHILLLNLYPVRYIPKSGELYYYTDMHLTVSVTPVEPDLENYRNLSKDENLIKNLVDNPEYTASYNGGGSGSETYDYVVITDTTFANAFQNLTNWKETRGKYTEYTNLSTKIVLLEDIVANSSFCYDGYWGDGGDGGDNNTFNDTQCKIRNFIKMAHNRTMGWSTEYVLLGGDVEIIPARSFYVRYFSYEDNIPSDLYYGCLDGNWNDDKGPKWGEEGEDDLFAEVYIGRASADSVNEVNNFVKKTIAYENATSNNETYLKRAVMIGSISDEMTDRGNSKDKVTEIIPQYTTKKIYRRDGTYSKSRILTEMEDGTHIINYAGHSSDTSFNSPYSIRKDDVHGLSNNEYFLVYSGGCHSAAYDKDDAIGEEFITASGGAFAYIGNSRYGFYYRGSTYGPNDMYDRSFFRVLMNSNTSNTGKILQESKERLLVEEAYINRWTYYELNLLGDPETQIKTNISAPTAHFKPLTEYRLSPPIYNGTLELTGIAKKGNAENTTFSHYTIEYGHGLDPTIWYSTGVTLVDNGTNEITNGVLGYWNTSQVDDYYYTLRLTVFDNNTLIGRDWRVVIVANAFTIKNNDTGVYYNSLQKAIKEADIGDTLLVGNKTYCESIDLKEGIKLIGENQPLIDPTPSSTPYYAIQNDASSYTLISGFKLEKYIMLSNSNGVTITNCDFTNKGIFGYDSDNTTIVNCNFTNGYGFHSTTMGETTINNCNFISNEYGIYSYEGNGLITNCTFTNNEYGINFRYSFSRITNCNFINNKGYGIYFSTDTDGNIIYHNNFINNSPHVNTYPSNNICWDGGYPCGGNYWDDYNGSDYFLGPNQNISGSDGIGDTPYNISENSQDRYPLMKPWGTITPEITNVSHIPNIDGNGGNITITADIYSIGIDTVKVYITYPDSSFKEHIMKYTENFNYKCVFNDTWQKGQYNYAIWADAGIVNCSSEYSFSISSHCDFSLQTVKNVYYLNECVNLTNSKLDNTGDTDCRGYLGMGIEYNDSGNWILEDETINEITARTILHGEYLQLDDIFNNQVNTSNLFHEMGQYRIYATFRDPQGNVLINDDDTLMQTYYEFDCHLKIINVSATPDFIGYGYNVTISADIINDVNTVIVNITYPDDSIESFTMNHITENTYECVFNDTWQNGRYYYSIYVTDTMNNTNFSLFHAFDVSAQCNISIETLKEQYIYTDEYITIAGSNFSGINSSCLDSFCGGEYLGDALDGTGGWRHYENHTHWFILDLGESEKIIKVMGRSYSIFHDPTNITIYGSDDKENWTAIATDIDTWQDTREWQEIECLPGYSRYLKVMIFDTEHIDNHLRWTCPSYCYHQIFDVYIPQSKIDNMGSTDCKGYLLMNIEYNDTGSWILENETINETIPRIITQGEYLKLHSIFNDKINILNLTHGSGQYRVNATFRDPNGNILINDNDTLMSANYNFNLIIDVIPPEITNVSNNPDTVGFGFNVTINTNVTDNISGVNIVNVSITYPDSISTNYTMNNTIGDMYEYIFTDTWLVGQYNYTIWAIDHSSNINSSSGHNFNVLPIDDDDQEHIEDFQYEAIIISIWELYRGGDVIKSVTDVFDSASEIIDEEEQYRDGNEWKQSISIGSPIPITSKTINNIIVRGMISFAKSLINKGKHLALGPIFKGRMHTHALTNGNGNYHIYAVFGDDEGNVLKCTDDTYLVVKCEFTVTGR